MERELVVLFLAAGAALAQKGSISGTVLDAVTGQPLASAQLFGRATGPSVQATADKDGKYTFRNLDAGTYTLSAYAASRTGGVGAGTNRYIAVQAGQELTGIDFRVPPAPEISGRVVDENKEPVQGAQVLLVAREWDSGALRQIHYGIAITDDLGEYLITRVQAGRAYLVLARKWEYSLPAISPAPTDPKLRRRATLPTYYPGTVVLRPGEKREGLDIRLERGPSVCVEGVAEGPNGPGAMRVEIRPSEPHSGVVGDGGMYMATPGAMTGADGKFRFCDLSPGDYMLTALESAPGLRTPSFYGRAALTVGDRDIARVKAPAAQAVSISGEVVWAGEAPKDNAGAKPSVSLRALTRTTYSGETTSARVAVGDKLNLGPIMIDEYAVDVRGLPPQFYVQDITYGVQSVQYTTMRAGGAIGDATLRVLIGTDGGRVQVRCTDKDNNPVPDANVVVLPAEVTTEAELATRMVTGQADQNGSYSSPALRPGKYYVVATTQAVNRSPECLRQLLDARMTAKEITLAPNGQAQVTVAVAN